MTLYAQRIFPACRVYFTSRKREKKKKWGNVYGAGASSKMRRFLLIGTQGVRISLGAKKASDDLCPESDALRQH
jgi:hypothetical protein